MNTTLLAQAANEARGLAMDAVHACNSGHLGLPLGCAEIGAVLFGESQSRVLVSCQPEAAEAILQSGLPARRLGITGGRQLVIKTMPGSFAWDVAPLRDAWWNSIGRLMAG